MPRIRLAFGLASLACALGVMPTTALPAATPGIAYDSVTKFQKSGDEGLQPGSFTSDFQAAAQPAGGDDAPRGPFGLGKVMAKAQAAVAMFKTGTAEREYTAGSKQRVDHIALGNAEITDCAARTITTLDLKKKTYTVTSLDAPVGHAPPSGHHAAPEPAATDDGSKVAVAITTKSLGMKNLEGAAATGYDSDIKTTVTKPGSDPQTVDMALTAYYSAFARPSLACPEASRTGASQGPAAGAMVQYALAMRALRAGPGDGRFTVTSSGPALPMGKLPLWEAIAMKGEHDTAFNIVMERGNVHAISANDAIFAVPADFTKE
jgi:hypothetical protein